MRELISKEKFGNVIKKLLAILEGLSHEEKDFYSIGSSKEDKNFFLYGYNDDTQSVYYQINYEWVN